MNTPAPILGISGGGNRWGDIRFLLRAGDIYRLLGSMGCLFHELTVTPRIRLETEPVDVHPECGQERAVRWAGRSKMRRSIQFPFPCMESVTKGWGGPPGFSCFALFFAQNGTFRLICSRNCLRNWYIRWKGPNSIDEACLLNRTRTEGAHG